MNSARYVVTAILLLVIIASAHAEWIKVRITDENSQDWPPAAMPESVGTGYFIKRLDSLAYDPARKVLVLFKGRRTFEYDGTTWSIKDSGKVGGPGHISSHFPLRSPVLIYYPELQGVFLYGGITGYIDASTAWGTSYCWIWNGSEWVLPPDTCITHRPALGSHAGIYDSSNASILLFGGEEADGNFQRGTFSYNGIAWKKVSEGKPTPRLRSAMAFDKRRDVVVLYGGFQEFEYPVSKVFSDTWEWDGKKWTRITNTGPGPRAGHSLVYLPELKRVVLFGGFSAPLDPHTGKRVPVPHNDLWSWDGKRWTRLPHTRPAPNPRYGHGAAYDSDSHQMVIYGGEDGTKSFRDLWYYRAGK